MSEDGQRPARLLVSVVDAQGRPFRAPGLARWLKTVAPARAQGAITVAFASDARVRALNRTYRSVDRATDVLSFPVGLQTSGSRLQTSGSRLQGPEVHGQRSAARSPKSVARSPKSVVRSPKSEVRSPESGVFLGDIVIARGVARRQARAQAHAESTEWRVLALHGLLHLLGYDHDADSGVMRRLEQRLRRRGGLEGGLIEREPPPPRLRRPRGPAR